MVTSGATSCDDSARDATRVLVKVTPGGIEPLSLFVGRGGVPPSQRRWHQYFEEANDRLANFEGQVPMMSVAVTPTCAIRLPW